ncbi:MAG TPA: PAS domain-containing protein [Balneolales bacterium]|nr:PAS domain-containing protein [Balneolales bacterium]
MNNLTHSRLQSSLQLAHMAAWEWNFVTNEFVATELHDPLFGYPPGKKRWDIETFKKHIDPADFTVLIKKFRDVLESKNGLEAEFRISWPNGSIHWLWTRAVVTQWAGDDPVILSGVTTDVTSRKQAELETQEYRKRLEKTQELARIGYWEYYFKNGSLHWSDTIYEMFGLSPQTSDLTLDNFLKMVHPDDRHKLEIAQKRPLDKNLLFDSDYRLIKPNGEIGYYKERGEFIKDEQNKPVKLTGAIIDLTELEKAETQLATSEQTYRLLFQHNPLPSFIYDFDSWEILEVNRAAIQHYGYTKKEFTSLTLHDIYLPEDIPALQRRQKQIKRQFSNSGEWRHVTKDGSLIRVEITSVGLEYQNRNCRRVVINDITKQKKEEQERLISMIEGEDRERKRIAMDLHDSLAQYLTAATMNLSAVKNLVNLFPKHKQEQFFNGLALVKDALQETRNIAQNLMPKAIENFGLVSALTDLFQKTEQANDINILFDHDIGHLELKRQIEINIYRITQEALANALKHSEANKIEVTIKANRHSISYLFVDNGKGYKPEMLNETRKGLGLSNMHVRAHSMLASLDINSMPGLGTSIALKIPHST